MRAGVVVGNPKPRSRTHAAAVRLTEELCGRRPDVVIDVVDLGAGLMGFGDPAVGAAVADVTACDVIVVASPTFKGSYTGVLKLFLDQVPTGGWANIVAYPVMVGAGPGHAMAPELTLRPVLVELGASCPQAGLYLLEAELDSTGLAVDWLTSARRWLPASEGGAR